ncbi:MAG: DegV family protein [Candidatus Izemoplasma sp.]
MGKIAIISTSTGCLDYIDVNHENLRILRMKILIGEKTFEDYIELTSDQFYDMLISDTSLVPSSSMPSIGEMLEMFTQLEKEGYEEVILITISSQLSGTYEVGLMAQKQYEGKIKIHVLDSRNAAISEGYISLVALDMVKAGRSSAEIIKSLEKIRTARKQYFVVDNLRLFVANGRLSGASGFVGSMFKIKPILEVNDDGKIVSLEKIRTSKKALNRIVEIITEDIEKLDEFLITFDTSTNLEGLKFIKDQLEILYPGYKYLEAPITPVVGCHTGVGAVGVAVFDLSVK